MSYIVPFVNKFQSHCTPISELTNHWPNAVSLLSLSLRFYVFPAFSFSVSMFVRFQRWIYIFTFLNDTRQCYAFGSVWAILIISVGEFNVRTFAMESSRETKATTSIDVPVVMTMHNVLLDGFPFNECDFGQPSSTNKNTFECTKLHTHTRSFSKCERKLQTEW